MVEHREPVPSERRLRRATTASLTLDAPTIDTHSSCALQYLPDLWLIAMVTRRTSWHSRQFLAFSGRVTSSIFEVAILRCVRLSCLAMTRGGADATARAQRRPHSAVADMLLYSTSRGAGHSYLLQNRVAMGVLTAGRFSAVVPWPALALSNLGIG